MTDHPIKPTDKAYENARQIWRYTSDSGDGIRKVLEYGVREGANYELEACCACLRDRGLYAVAENLEKSRRPSLKVRALVALDEAVLCGESFASSEATKIIRNALEGIDD